MKCVIADTGPLVAMLDRDDQDHAWAVREGRRLPPKMLSCEAVLSEVNFLTQDLPEAKARIEDWLADGRLELPFTVRDHHSLVHELMARYANVPMSFADACLVRMSELWPDAPVFTLDSDFRVYRRNKRQSLPLICP
ncbi:MAG: pilus assembly protein [Chthoniobacterales bacterium]|nr:pilus assembly protein [Chthoniobacterales bacterium]